MILQTQMQRAGVTEGWARGLRLIRRIAGNARYFTDSSSKVPIDVAAGDAAVGTCIDYYGRFQGETVATAGRPGRVGYASASGETMINADPIGLLRGAPHRALAIDLIEFIVSEEGQKLWSFRRGTPGGPQQYALRRLPILPVLYEHRFDDLRADPDENPYEEAQGFTYRPEWTAPLFSTIAFVVRVMCVDAATELTDAYGALSAAGFPPEATAAFDDVSAVDHATASGPLRAALRSPDPLQEAAWARRLLHSFRDGYARAAALARQGR